MWLKANLAPECLPRRIASSTSSINRAPRAQRGATNKAIDGELTHIYI
jgi:hypothetical protein